VKQAMARRESLAELSRRLPLAAPLVLSLDRQIARFLPDLVALIRSGLTAPGEQRPDEACLALLGSLSPNVLACLASEDDTTTAITAWLDGIETKSARISPLPEAAEVLEGLWLDTDPSVALWALMVLRQVDSRQAERMLQTPRTELPSSKTLKGFLEGEQLASIEILAAIADQPLIQRLEPGALVGLDRLCNLRQWRQGDPVERPGGGVLILLAGSCEQRQSLVPGSAPKTIAEHGSGTIVGLADYFGEHKSGSQARLVASPDGCSALVFSRTGFGNLLDVSPIFEQSLIRELAISCESLQRSLQAARQQQQHQRMRRINSEQLG
jgi:hypothetical protein